MRIILVAALVLTSGLALADEGQWQPYQMPSIADKLQQRGIDIPASQLADLGQYPMNAVVSLGYCTASFVSPQGLVVTNHHCAYRGIQYNSKKEHNYLANGFLANTQAEEPSAGPNERLYITQAVTNVTDEVMANLSTEPMARFEGIETNSKALIKLCEADDNYRCSVNSFHHGLEYYLTKQLIIRDVRLVYAPPKSVGGFGGDIDNYEYPRHSGDFTFLRAYVGKDGKPATFNKNNVPYRPKSYLKINADGVKAGDGIFVAGFPGSTSRYNLTSELQFASDWIYPTYAKRYQLQIDTITLMGDVDNDIALKYAGTIASMANRMKKLNGLLDGFSATDIVGIKQQRENDFLAWLKKDPGANQELINNLEALLAEQHQQMQTTYFFKNAQSSEMLQAASKLYRLAQERKKPNDQRESGFQLRDMKMFKAALKRIDSSFDPVVDKILWLQDLQAYISQPLKNKVFDNALSISDDFEELESKVEGLYALTELTDQAKRLAWMSKTAEEFEVSGDPFIRLAVAIYDTNMAMEKSEKLLYGKLSSVRPEYMKAIIDYYKSNNWPVYPDANRTLRITYGMVDGYQSKDALYKQPFTLLAGILAKNTGEAPYNAPTKLLDAIKADDLGKHRVTSVYRQQSSCQFMSCLDKPADFNSVPVNFLSSADTTGGNSGSPVFNGKGELVGLNFDSTYEAITKDWFFNPTITRAVHVDIRYILWMMDKVDHADNLIKELTLVTNTAGETEIPADTATEATIEANTNVDNETITESVPELTTTADTEDKAEFFDQAIEATTEAQVTTDLSDESAPELVPTVDIGDAVTEDVDTEDRVELSNQATTEVAIESELASESTPKLVSTEDTEDQLELSNQAPTEVVAEVVNEAANEPQAATEAFNEATDEAEAATELAIESELSGESVPKLVPTVDIEDKAELPNQATTEAAAGVANKAANKPQAASEVEAEVINEATNEAQAESELSSESAPKLVPTVDIEDKAELPNQATTEAAAGVANKAANKPPAASEVEAEVINEATNETQAEADLATGSVTKAVTDIPEKKPTVVD